jgi:predicted MPP superfamily phosphohydrolase
LTLHTRRQFLKRSALLAGTAVLPAPALAAQSDEEPHAERRTFLLPGLDPAHDGLRVVQLTDLHVGWRTPASLIRAAIEEANRFEPDLVVLTGDFVGRDKEDVGIMRDLLGGLAAPTFAVLGNHDHWVDARGAGNALRSHGYEVLENAWTRIALRGAPFTIVGVGDLRTRHEDVARATAGLSGGATPLALAHVPKTAERLRALDRPMLCFSGHTHGGQVNLPILTPIVMHGLARQPYVRGRYRLGDVQLYVSRGVGNSGVLARLNAPPEVTLATLRAA